MGIIKKEIFDYHLSRYTDEEKLINPFKMGFDINWARRRKAFNTEISVYFISPEPFMAETFGFDHEILLVISDFPTIEPRTMQAIESFFNDDPAKGRVDQSIFFFITPAKDGRAWLTSYTTRNPQSRIPIIFNDKDLIESKGDDWHIRNVIRAQLFTRNFFDYQLPLDNDLYFFGRDAVIADHLDAIKRSQNRGLFGLRKTGKTSILFKLKRIIDRDNLGKVLYYDCKLPDIRNMRWYELLNRIMSDISKEHGIKIKKQNDERKVSKAFMNLLSKTTPNSFTCLVFDEIEWISPFSKYDVHWKSDFVPFWQTLWSTQSQVRRLSNIVAGVNPFIVENDVVDGVQNPMFGIVQHRYLKGFTESELRNMLHFFGRRMGLIFDQKAIQYLYKRYGGHPLLTRLACSQLHSDLELARTTRPITIDLKDLIENEENRDSELIFYCRHVVSEIKEFYSDEYEMLEFLASGRVNDFMDFRSAPEYTRHLQEYGLVEIDSVGKPSFAIPVVGRYIGAELARKQGCRLRRHVIPSSNRTKWVTKRASEILSSVRDLEQIISKLSLPKLYGDSSFPEAERFSTIYECKSHSHFVDFINVCNRCFVESIEKYGRTLGKTKYFWDVIALTYPELFIALKRIKLYRHNDLHLELNESVEKDFKAFLNEDLEGKRLSQVDDVWFLLQQCVLDSMFLGTQCEINRIS